MRGSRFGRKAAVAVLVGGVLVAGIGVAWAATTGSGRGSGVVNVGKSTSAWTVNMVAAAPPLTYIHPITPGPPPGTPTVAHLRFHVIDTIPGNLWLNNMGELSAKVLSASAATPAAFGTGTAWTPVNHRPIPHCTPTWFKILNIQFVTPNMVLPMKFKANSSFDVFVDVALITAGATVNQNACLGQSPAVQLSVAP